MGIFSQFKRDVNFYRFNSRYLDFSANYPKLIRRFPSYQDQIKSFRKNGAIERCYLVGGGPSLNLVDWSKIKDGYFISTNASHNLLLSKGIFPKFSIVEDRNTAVKISINRLFSNLRERTIPLVSLNNADLSFPYNTVYFNTNCNSLSSYYRDICFSKSFESIAFLGGTVLYIAMQFAYFMEFKEVIVLGLDFSYGERFEEKFRNQQGQTIQLDDEAVSILKQTHFSKEYIGSKVGDLMNVPDWDLQRSAFTLANLEFTRANRVLLNGSAISTLEVIPKVKL